MKRSKFIIGLTATALVLPLGAFTAAATEVAPTTATAWTEWISDDGGSAGRELPAMSADGRYVVMVGRSSEFGGVWVKDRAKPAALPVQVASGFLFNPDISADGSTVAWTQYGSGSSGGQQIYMKKWQDPDASAMLVSLGDDDQPTDGITDFPSLSRNGRYVAFQSMDMTLDAQAIVGKQGGNRTKAYVRDVKLGTTEMVSVTDANEIPNGSGIKPDITPDGRYVAFASDAPILQPVVTEEDATFQQVYVRDRVEKTTTCVSVSSSEVLGNGASATIGGPTISDNGLRVAFDSMATNLVSGDTNADIDAFVRKIGGGWTDRVSLDEAGMQVDTDDDGDVEPGDLEDDPDTKDDESTATIDALPVGAEPVISGDGLFVAYASQGTMTADDENGVNDVYRYDLTNGVTTRQSVVDDAADSPLDDPADPDDAFEATGDRIDGHTGDIVSASNGATPAIGYNGASVAFVSQGNLTGIAVEEEEGDDGDTEVEGSSIEPNVYLHRPNPEPDTVPPVSRAISPDLDKSSPIKVRYKKGDGAGFPASGVKAVRLYVKKPNWAGFRLVRVDRVPDLDNVFFVKAFAEGRYKFYTRAVDNAGNIEPTPAKRDDVTIFRR